MKRNPKKSNLAKGAKAPKAKVRRQGRGILPSSTSWPASVVLVAAALLLAFHICILGPYQIYTNNQAEFESSFRAVLPWLLAASALLMTILIAMGLGIRRRMRSTYAVGLFGLSMLLWIQGSFVRWDYGDFNGVNIDWGQYTWRGWIDALLWLVVLVLVLRFRKNLHRVVPPAVAMILVLQTGWMLYEQQSAAEPAMNTEGRSTDPGAPEVPPEVCRISNHLNIFHVILDSFQTDVFMELVQEENLADELEGFVVYRDNAAPASQTILCIPAILSGRVYDGSLLPSENYRAAASGGFHSELAEHGYVVNLMPYIEMPSAPATTHYVSPRSYAWPRQTRIRQSASFMLDVSLFRQLPHFLKRVIYNGRNWRISQLVATPPNHVSFHQKEFFRDYIQKIQRSYARPAYHFLHLSPPHPPYVTLADGSYAGKALPDTRENFKNEARYVLRIFMEFLQKLKDVDAYDESIIVLQGDHGSTFTPVWDGQEYPVPVNRLPALLTVKAPSARGPLSTSNAPTRAADVPATIMELLELEHSYEGESVVSLQEGTIRQREYVTLNEEPGQGRVLRTWSIEGSIYEPSSFNEVDPQEVQPQLREYAWGNRLSFGVAGIGESYLRHGWAATRAMHWSTGHEAQMQFRITPPDADVLMKLIFFFYIVPGEVDQQRIRISVNGTFLGEHSSREPKAQEFEQIVPKSLLQSDLMTINFEFPDAAVLSANRKEPIRRAMALWSFHAEMTDNGRDARRSSP